CSWPARSQKEEEQDLCNECGSAVEQNVLQRSGATGKVELVPLVEGGNQGSHEERNSCPLDCPGDAKREGGAPGAKEQKAQGEVTHKVTGFADDMLPERKFGPSHTEQEMQYRIEKAAGVFG